MTASPTPDPDALGDYYRQAQEKAREFITLVKVAEESNGEAVPGNEHLIRGQIRQYVGAATPAQTWLLIEVLVRSVAATFDDLADWSDAVIRAVAEEVRDD